MIAKFSFPAIAYMRPVRQWALSMGMPFTFWKDQRKALARYEMLVAQLN